jgi:hypothetical protein
MLADRNGKPLYTGITTLMAGGSRFGTVEDN